MSDPALAYVDHILREIEVLAAVPRRYTLQNLQADPLAYRGAIYSIQTISEAARKLPLEITDRYPEIRWREIRAIGNVTRHEYAGLKPAIVWEIITLRAPELRPVMLQILKELDT